MRPFHFVAVKATPSGLEAVTHGLRRGDRPLHVMEPFTLKESGLPAGVSENFRVPLMVLPLWSEHFQIPSHLPM